MTEDNTLYDFNSENIISTFNKIILEYCDYSVNYSTSFQPKSTYKCNVKLIIHQL